MSAYLPHRARVRTFVAALDLGMLAVTSRLAFELRFAGSALGGSKWDEIVGSPGLMVWAVVSAIGLAAAAELYEPEILYRRWETLVRLVFLGLFWTGSMALATYLVPEWEVGRGVLALTVVLWIIGIIGLRFAITTWIRQRSRTFEALVIGEGQAVSSFCDALRRKASSPWRPVDASQLRLSEIPAEVERRGASMVVLASGERRQEVEQDLVDLHFSGVPIIAASELWAWLEERLPLEALSPAVFLHQPGFGAVHWTLFNRVTRVADLVLASFLVCLSLPIFGVATLVVLAADGAPIIFRQTRLGQFGRPFVMVKLRTMVNDAERDGPVFAQERDPRTIPGGHFLRRFRIDELPQLWNVIRGEMSLVGPRPERPEMASTLSDEIPYYSFRLAVPPGITGWAQVNVPYARDLEDHQRKLEYDLYFIRERSTRLYLLTLLRTLNAALIGARPPRYVLPDEAERERVANEDGSITPRRAEPRDAGESPRSDEPTTPGRGAPPATSVPGAPSVGPVTDPEAGR